MNITNFCQRDQKWCNDELGTSDVTIHNYGCLVTALASFSKLAGDDTDPGKLNKEFINKGIYNNGNRIVWGRVENATNLKLEKIGYATNVPVSLAQFSEMMVWLRKGIPVILHVDFNPGTPRDDMHFVLLVGKEGKSWMIMDPWTGEIEKLAKYGVAKYTIKRYIIYNFVKKAMGRYAKGTVVNTFGKFHEHVQHATINWCSDDGNEIEVVGHFPPDGGKPPVPFKFKGSSEGCINVRNTCKAEQKQVTDLQTRIIKVDKELKAEKKAVTEAQKIVRDCNSNLVIKTDKLKALQDELQALLTASNMLVDRIDLLVQQTAQTAK